MNPGDLVIRYTLGFAPNELIEYGDVGIILEGSWKLGRYRVLFAREGIRQVENGMIRRIRVHST
jgi:hypothetical protein